MTTPHSSLVRCYGRTLAIAATLAIALLHPLPLSSVGAGESPSYQLVIHGGAGVIRRQDLSAELDRRYREELRAALEAGSAILAAGGSALDAVETTIRRMEDSPLFNAGKGAVFTAAGTNEMDASIMDGATRAAGAVAGVTTIRNPISAARKVMEETRHVLLAGPGAESFAAEAGLEIVEPSYFHTERRWQQLQKAREREAAAAAGNGGGSSPHFGTVGAAALDGHGRLAAGTSTGGLTNKMHGRIGDSPILGAGTWADDLCAVSGTGHGESFMRNLVAFDICARARYRGSSLKDAADEVVHQTLVEAGGDGGVIVLGADGTFRFSFNTEGMYRGYARGDGSLEVAIFADESLEPDPAEATR